MRELAELFFLFARIGCVMFGGGYAMLPILERELVDKRHWVTSEEIADYYAISQCLQEGNGRHTTANCEQADLQILIIQTKQQNHFSFPLPFHRAMPQKAAPNTASTGERLVKVPSSSTTKKMMNAGTSTNALLNSLIVALRISTQTQARTPAKALRTTG